MHPVRRAFTLIEVLAVVLILAILSGLALPRFYDYQIRARLASCKGTLGGVRAGIANYYADQAIAAGAAAYPSLAQLTTVGTVMQEKIPDNPYTVTADTYDADEVNTAAKADADDRNLLAGGDGGWAYFDGTGGFPAVFYANTDAVAENSF